MNELGEFLKKKRGKKSLREVAKECGISHTYLDTLEKGYDPRTKKERKPSPEVLQKLAAYYKVEYTYLMYLAGYIDKYTYEQHIVDGSFIVTDLYYMDMLEDAIYFKGRLLTKEEIQKVKKILETILD